MQVTLDNAPSSATAVIILSLTGGQPCHVATMPRRPSRSGRHEKVEVAGVHGQTKARIAKAAISPSPQEPACVGAPTKSCRKARATVQGLQSAGAGARQRDPEAARPALSRRRPARCITTAPGSCWWRPFFRRSAPTCASTWSRRSSSRNTRRRRPLPRSSRKSSKPDIRSTGFFRNKSKSVVGAARKLISEFGGQVPRTMDELLQLPGVARKTANVVLGTWYKIADGVVVDTHVQRISRRLELTKNERPAEDRAGPDEGDPARQVDCLRAPDHPAWPRASASRANPSAPIVRWRTSATPPTRPGARWRFTRRQSRRAVARG